MYFTIEELTKSYTAKRLGIDNTPSGEELSNLYRLMNRLLEPIRLSLGKPIIVNSGYRSAELNKAVGGVKNSQHLKGEAADITTVGGKYNKELWDLIIDMINKDDIIVGQLIDEKGLSWIHISLPNTKHVNEILCRP